MKKKYLIASSNTSSNIGNAFFYEGIKYVFRNFLDSVEVFDGLFPLVNPYNLKNKKSIDNIFDYLSCNDGVDATIIAGPVLDINFESQFEKTLKNAKDSGKKLIFLSIGSRKYDQDEIIHCRKVLSKYSPDIFISRDRQTYDAYRDLAKRAYDGVCFSFFINDYFKGYPTPALIPYIVSCFDFSAEPPLSFLAEESQGLAGLNSSPTIKAHKTKNSLKRLRYILSRNLPEQVAGLKIIRTCHRPLRSKHLIFFKKNILASFSPEPYLNLYKNAELTITDRLHAAVATLTFGNPARLVLDSERTKLLDRARCEKVRDEFIVLPKEYINTEKEKMVNWLCEEMRNV